MSRRLHDVVARVLDVPAGQVTDEFGRATVGAWTSLAHLRLVKAVEDTYGVALSGREIRAVSSVGDLRRLLDGRGIVP